MYGSGSQTNLGVSSSRVSRCSSLSLPAARRCTDPVHAVHDDADGPSTQEDQLNQLRQRHAMGNFQQRSQFNSLQLPPQQSRDASASAAYNFGGSVPNAQPVDTSNLLGSSSSSVQDTYKPHQSHYTTALNFPTPGNMASTPSWTNSGLFGADLLSQPSIGMGGMASFNTSNNSQPLYVPPSPSTSRNLKRPADAMGDMGGMGPNKRQSTPVAVTNQILGFAGVPPLNYANNPNSMGSINGMGNLNGMNGMANMGGMGGMGLNQGMGSSLNGMGGMGSSMNGAGGMGALNGGGMNNLLNAAMGLGNFNASGQNQFFQDANRMGGNGMNLGLGGMQNPMGMQQNGGYGMNGMNVNGMQHGMGNVPSAQFYASQQNARTFQHYDGSQGRFQQPPPRQLDQAQLAQQRQRQAALEAQKAKAKASAIYAKRTELKKGKGKDGDGSDADSDYDDRSGGRPRQPRPKKRRVVDSDDDGDDFGDGDERGRFISDIPLIAPEELARRALQIFNTNDETSLTELLNCTPEQAKAVIELRPYASADEFEGKLKKVLTKGKGRGMSVPTRMFEECQDQLRGYHAVDTLVEQCEHTGNKLRAVLDMWSQHNSASGSGTRTPENERDAALHLVAVAPPTNEEIARRAAMKDYISKQPALVREEYTLKDYQMLGLNWLNLLYSRNLSCILADEMGLGKTIQVISFFAHLKERGNKGPHLIVVPSSTLENWVRELERFAPEIKVQTYYGGQKDRTDLRATLVDKADKPMGWEVLVTTYNLAQSSDLDRKFLRRIDWVTCVFDEGHVLKNCQSQRYNNLMKIHSRWRLLLTGTPLQNNLQELVSLMSFILPDQFEPVVQSLRAIFKVKNEATNMLYRERTMRAKRMMMPFVLRRRKDQVLKDLPKKTERIEWCEMTESQSTHYREVLQRSRKMLLEQQATASASAAASATATPQPETPQPSDKAAAGRAKRKKRELAGLELDTPPTPESRAEAKKKLLSGGGDLSTNVLMDLRKAASHPALFRHEFNDALLKKMARACKQDEQFRDSNEAYIIEDMSVMTDSELQHFCQTHDCVAKFSQPDDMFLNSGKIKKLIELLDGFAEAKRRVLIFSQFTQVLDILRAVLDLRDTKYLILTGQTAVDTRLGLVDEFNQDESISVFLLSTKAGGMGINLTAASVVILFDQDFNPHNDKQAADRAYRIGQQNDVDVIKLISKGTIEEDIMRLGETKLQLDEAVAGEALGAAAAEGEDAENAGESVAEKQIKASLVESIKRQLEAPPPPVPAPVPSEDDLKQEEDGADDVKTEDGDE
ncbi:hypothetical protein EXIGLDRAFT_644468 [Exidia glandulosa HHB12029]|uniref:DNA helicase n=1 Tax=Exidia glandulosa HHB12029 TaxID=1314781 RepID=A0A165JQ72_EXIGL|nr:hypothetical protein EXIGLDRAFT_644468 [Exidia glandulosa HHB12029]